MTKKLQVLNGEEKDEKSIMYTHFDFKRTRQNESGESTILAETRILDADLADRCIKPAVFHNQP